MTVHSPVPASGVSLAAHTPAPVDVIPIPPTSERQQFMDWLRKVAPYIHAFRDKAFVISFGSELVKANILGALVGDVALLHAMGIRIVLVRGSCPQMEGQLALRSVQTRFVGGVHVVDAAVLESAKEVSGELRLGIEAAFSQGLPNTPMTGAHMSVVSGNFVTTRPVGIVSGVDFQHTGLVHKVDAESTQRSLSDRKIVLLSPLSFSPTGQTLSLSMEDVVANVAMALKADELIFITKLPGIMDHVGKLQQNLSMETTIECLHGGNPSHDTTYCLQRIVEAMCDGMRRAHVIPLALGDSVLLELFLHDGVGTMVSHTDLEYLREATPDNVGGVVSLIELLEMDGTLVLRERRLLERDIANFSVIEHDGIIFGYVTLYPYPKDGMAEMACLIVSPDSQGTGDGERLLRHTEVRAHALGLKRLFVLTTRTEYWFLKCGSVRTSVGDLPEDRRKLYNWRRRSMALMKKL